MPEKIITYFGLPAKVCCDGNCKKAWGISNRPRVQLSENEDDYEYLADGELDDAPQNPGTYEGGEGKPLTASCFPTKWCVRECERCNMSDVGDFAEPLEVRSFEIRRRNIKPAM